MYDTGPGVRYIKHRVVFDWTYSGKFKDLNNYIGYDDFHDVRVYSI